MSFLKPSAIRYIRCRNSWRARGYTLLEVLIALLVFSIGLLGLAAMLVSAVKGNHQAYHRSQAVFIATAMSEGMRSNLPGVNQLLYETPGLISSHDARDCEEDCSVLELVDRDLMRWADMANNRLPAGQVGINCRRQTAPAGAPTFNGVCRVRVAWNETGDVGQAAASTQSIFSWMVQP